MKNRSKERNLDPLGKELTRCYFVMRIAGAGMAIALGGVAASGLAQDKPATKDDGYAQQLLNANGCAACHTVDKRVVGPSYREVAARYMGDAEAPANLVLKIKAGGVGTWGGVPMPPNPWISDGDLGAIVGWILQQR